MQLFVALLAGLLFGVGLILSGMSDLVQSGGCLRGKLGVVQASVWHKVDRRFYAIKGLFHHRSGCKLRWFDPVPTGIFRDVQCAIRQIH